MLSFFGLLPISLDREGSASLVLVFASLLLVFLVHRLVELRVVVNVIEVLLLGSAGRLALCNGKRSPHAVIDLHEAMLLTHLKLALISVETVGL